MPVSSWLFVTWFMRRYKVIDDVYREAKTVVGKTLNKKQQTVLISVFLLAFIFMEIIWRMMFEYLIAYMRIYDVLMQS